MIFSNDMSREAEEANGSERVAFPLEDKHINVANEAFSPPCF